MTAEQKANNIISKIYPKIRHNDTLNPDFKLIQKHAKECALICIDEIIKVVSLINDGCGQEVTMDYWEQVKTELEKM